MILTEDIMYEALLKKDSSFEGQFFAAIKTTGIFCRPTCTARKPRRENVAFFTTSKECMMNGFRPCLVCKPLNKLLDLPGPVKEVLDQLAKDPSQKIKDEDLRLKGIEPARLRRWFLKQHGITFQAYQRMMKMNDAVKRMKDGNSVTETAYSAGFESLSGFTESFKNTFGVSPKNGKSQRVINIQQLETPVGKMIAWAVDEGICLLEFVERKNLQAEMEALSKQLNGTLIQGSNSYFTQLERELDEYFSGKRQLFEVPLFIPGTDFQKEVWQALQAIPYGQTRSYSQQAIAIGKPGSVRAVANANGMNRIAILIPCHRVIGSNGLLTGYAGGLWRKKYLLELEQSTIHANI